MCWRYTRLDSKEFNTYRYFQSLFSNLSFPIIFFQSFYSNLYFPILFFQSYLSMFIFQSFFSMFIFQYMPMLQYKEMITLRHDKDWKFELEINAKTREPFAVRTQKRAFDFVFAKLGPDSTNEGKVPLCMYMSYVCIIYIYMYVVCTCVCMYVCRITVNLNKINKWPQRAALIMTDKINHPRLKLGI